MKRLIRFSAALLVTCLAATAQQTLRVPARYQTISLALAAAAKGDTVLVSPGTYTESIAITTEVKVVSTGGAALTTLRPTYSAVVSFGGSVGRGAVLDGFTITGSNYAGIACYDSSPTLRNLRIVGNSARKQGGGGFEIVYDGAGIYCSGASPLIDRCTIQQNRIYVSNGLTGSYFLRGAGIYASGGSLDIRDSVITHNTIYCNTYSPQSASGAGISCGTAIIANSVIGWNSVSVGGFYSTSATGGGLAVGSKTTIVHCVVHGNSVSGNNTRDGAGVAGGTMLNSVVRGNTGAGQVHRSNVTYCNVEGGLSGSGNIDAEPKFDSISPTGFRIGPTSPCRNAGSSASTALPKFDVDGDPRVAESAPDMGIDEFHAHLTVAGAATPGGMIALRTVGPPGQSVYWAFSRHRLNPPATIPGLSGQMHLNPSAIALIPFGLMPASGELTFYYRFAPTFPPLTIPTQVLVGTQLSNLVIVDVK